MCQILKVSQSRYYEFRDRSLSERAKKNALILNIIKQIHEKHEAWGVDPIYAEVKETIMCSRGTINRIMKANGIKSKRKPKWKATTNSNHDLSVAPNLLNQNFEVNEPNKVWVGDITYIEQMKAGYIQQ